MANQKRNNEKGKTAKKVISVTEKDLAKRKESKIQRTRMATRTRRKKKMSSQQYGMLILIALGINILLMFTIYMQNANNVLGVLRYAIFGMIGVSAYLLPIVMLVALVYKSVNQGNERVDEKIKLASLILLNISTFAHILQVHSAQIHLKLGEKNLFFPALANYFRVSGRYRIAGGFFGGLFGDVFLIVLGKWGAILLGSILFIAMFLLFTEISFVQVLEWIQKAVVLVVGFIAQKIGEMRKSKSKEEMAGWEQDIIAAEILEGEKQMEQGDVQPMPDASQESGLQNGLQEEMQEPKPKKTNIFKNFILKEKVEDIDQEADSSEEISPLEAAIQQAKDEAENKELENKELENKEIENKEEVSLEFADDFVKASEIEPETEAETIVEAGEELSDEEPANEPQAQEEKPAELEVQHTGAQVPETEKAQARETELWENKPEKVETQADSSHENTNALQEVEEAAMMPYVFPPLDILKEPVLTVENESELIQNNAKKLEDTLQSFGVSAKVINVSKGPTVTRYEIQPAQGVKVSRIVNLTDDIALNLAAAGIRMEAPIPGKSAIGIEVPNREAGSVMLREVVGAAEFEKSESKLSFGLGKDISGKAVITDIAKMPHLLIAGATGSGKSVCINTLIVSLLYKAKPEEVRLLMIDPKVVELSIYNGIPHLLIPVVTDPKKAAGALNWAVQEMNDRYKLFAAAGVRDLKGYNQAVEQKGDGSIAKLPQIVIIVDELADLMMVASGEVEDTICRLAQMARAAGLHLIIATQRPSVDVITGLIKANIPSRIAFNVSSGTDSRTILDMNGAEKLLGKGDMLFYPVGNSKPVRIQGAFISDHEVESIVEFLKTQQQTRYNQKIMNHLNKSEDASTNAESKDDLDEFFADALELVVDKERASASMLQRYFRIGFNRAARILDQLAEAGYVGEEQGSKPRDVLLTRRELESLKRQAKERERGEVRNSADYREDLPQETENRDGQSAEKENLSPENGDSFTVEDTSRKEIQNRNSSSDQSVDATDVRSWDLYGAKEFGENLDEEYDDRINQILDEINSK